MAQPFSAAQLPTLGPQQLQGIQNLISSLGNTQPNINAISQRARHQFQTQTIPTLAERFTSLGQGAQRSSAFQGALGSAGADLESQLAGLETNFGLQQQNLLARLLTQPQFENIITPEREGFWGPFLGSTAEGLGKAAPSIAQSIDWGKLLGAGTAGTAAGTTATALAPTLASALGGTAGTTAAATLPYTAASALGGTAAGTGTGAGLGTAGTIGGTAAATAAWPILALLAALAAGYGAYSYLDAQD